MIYSYAIYPHGLSMSATYDTTTFKNILNLYVDPSCIRMPIQSLDGNEASTPIPPIAS